MVKLLLVLLVLLIGAPVSAAIEDDIKNGHLDNVKAFLQNEENLEEMSATELLYLAAQYGKLDIVQYLLDHGVAVNERGEDNRSALSAAVENANKEVITFLLAKGAEMEDAEGFTVLTDAVMADSQELIDFFLDKGVNVNAASCAGDACTSALRLAAAKGNIKLFLHLIEKGAKLETTLPYDDVEGNILNSAVFGGNLDIVRYILQKGFDIHYSEKHLKKSLLSSAVNSDSLGVLAVIDYLIDAGLDVNYKDSFKKTVFFDVWTSEYETAEEKDVKEKVLIKLLDRGLAVCDVDEVGNTPLHHACDLGFVNVVRALLAKKAPLAQRNAQNETPLDIARNKDLPEIVALLEEAEAKSR